MSAPAFLATSSAPASSQNHRVSRFVLRGLIVGVAAAALVGGAGSYASAETAADSTSAHVQVGNAISLTGLTPSFTLAGIPGATDTVIGAVTFTVKTNNFAGYYVTVEPLTETMTSDDPANTDSIPTSLLQVRKTGGTAYAALGVGTTQTVQSKASASAEAGDTVSNDYRIVVPFVRDDTYTATLNYIATTL